MKYGDSDGSLQEFGEEFTNVYIDRAKALYVYNLVIDHGNEREHADYLKNFKEKNKMSEKAIQIYEMHLIEKLHINKYVSNARNGT